MIAKIDAKLPLPPKCLKFLGHNHRTFLTQNFEGKFFKTLTLEFWYLLSLCVIFRQNGNRWPIVELFPVKNSNVESENCMDSISRLAIVKQPCQTELVFLGHMCVFIRIHLCILLSKYVSILWAWVSTDATGAWHPLKFWTSPPAPADIEVLNNNWHPQRSLELCM